MKHTWIMLFLQSLRLALLKTIEKCTVSPPVKPMVVRGPRGLEIRRQSMGAPVWRMPFQLLSEVVLWVQVTRLSLS